MICIPSGKEWPRMFELGGALGDRRPTPDFNIAQKIALQPA
jgi:hypothetical protein